MDYIAIITEILRLEREWDKNDNSGRDNSKVTEELGKLEAQKNSITSKQIIDGLLERFSVPSGIQTAVFLDDAVHESLGQDVLDVLDADSKYQQALIDHVKKETTA